MGGTRRLIVKVNTELLKTDTETGETGRSCNVAESYELTRQKAPGRHLS